MRYCKTCKSLERYTWLDDFGYCFKCSPKQWAPAEVLAQLIRDSQGPYSWGEWAEIAEKVSHIDMGCRFSPVDCLLKTAPDPRGCCSGCAASLGYLKNIPREAYDLLLKLFDGETGFWTPGGCSLPWGLRSPTCLSYRCKKLRDAENKEYWTPFYKAVGLLEKEFIGQLNLLPTKQEK